jgi:hypothetical protein
MADCFGWELYFMGALVAISPKHAGLLHYHPLTENTMHYHKSPKEVIFVKLNLETIGIGLNLPINNKVENVGAIYQAKNFSLSQNTTHIDICEHCVWEHQEEGTFKATFVRLKENESDVLL